MPSELIFGTFHFVRGENRRAYSPACSETAFTNLVQDFYSKGILATSEDFDDLHKNGTADLIKGQEKKVFFTFDDGYIEHYDYCANVLEKFNSRGLFFPVVESLIKKIVLDVNIIQLICANNTYLNVANEWLTKQELEANPLINSTDFSPAIFDDSIVQHIKRNLQSSPELMCLLEVDTALVSKVRDENKYYFDNLYFSYEQACDLIERGHIIGGHGESHQWLTGLETGNLSSELVASLKLVKNMLKNKKALHNFFCYPYGLTNKRVSARTLSFFDYSFTTEFGVLTSGEVREIPRVDVNLLRNFL